MHFLKLLLFILILIFPVSELYSQEYISKNKGFDYAIEAMNKGDYSQALQLLDALIRDHPEHTEAFWYRGITWDFYEEYEKALSDYTVVLEANPDRSEALLARGRTRYQLEQYDRAKEDFKAFLKAPLGETTQVIYRMSPSGNGVNQILTAQNSQPAEAYYHLALCSTAQEAFEESLIYLDSAISYRPKEADYYSEKGIAYAKLAQTENAMAQYEKALEINPSHYLTKQRMVFLEDDLDEEILEELTLVIAAAPENAEGFKQRGYYLMMNGDLERALEDFNVTMNLDPEDFETQFYQGKIFSQQGKWEKAESAYSKGLDIGGPNTEIHLARGQARYLNGRLDAALADFTLLTFYDPEDPGGFYHLGITYHRLKDLVNACLNLKKAKEMGMIQAAEVFEKVCGRED